jgi:hypothetical protein
MKNLFVMRFGRRVLVASKIGRGLLVWTINGEDGHYRAVLRLSLIGGKANG